MTQESLGRRNFLKVLAAGITAAVGLRLARKPAQASEPVGSSPHQWAMVIGRPSASAVATAPWPAARTTTRPRRFRGTG